MGQACQHRILLDAVDHQYLSALEDRVLGFATCTPRQLLQHLTTNYGTIKQSDIEKNREQMSDKWTPDQPIETLWARVKNCRDFATLAGGAIKSRTFWTRLNKTNPVGGVTR